MLDRNPPPRSRWPLRLGRGSKIVLVLVGLALCVIAYLSRYDIRPDGDPWPNTTYSYQDRRHTVYDRWTGNTFTCSISAGCVATNLTRDGADRNE